MMQYPVKNPQTALLRRRQDGEGLLPSPPYMLIDTSSLLTLLLGTEDIPRDREAGYLGLIQDQARSGFIRPVVTGAVLAEFLNSPVPLTWQDIFQMDAKGRATGIRYSRENRWHMRFRNNTEVEYPKWDQRLEFLMDLYNNGHVQLIETPTEKLYYDAIRAHPRLRSCFDQLTLDYPEQLGDMRDKSLAELTNAELKQFLLIPPEAEKPSGARQKFLYQLRRLKIRQDIGEVSLGDALHELHRHDMQTPVFILYEGNDVRGKLLRRRVNVDKSVYMAGEENEKLPSEFCPSHKKFNFLHIESLGNSHFLSTQGFVIALMHASRSYGGFIVSPREHEHAMPDDIDNPPLHSYPGSTMLMRGFAGRALHSERLYDKIVDEPAGDLGKNWRHSASIQHRYAGPWRQYIDALPPQVMRRVIANHLQRRLKQFESIEGHRSDQAALAQSLGAHTKNCLSALSAAPSAATPRPELRKVLDLDSAILRSDFSAMDARAIAIAETILQEYGEAKRSLNSIPVKLPARARVIILAVPEYLRRDLAGQVRTILEKAWDGAAEGDELASAYADLLESEVSKRPARQGLSIA